MLRGIHTSEMFILLGLKNIEKQHWIWLLVCEHVVGDIQLHGAEGYSPYTHDQRKQSTATRIHLFGYFHDHPVPSGNRP